MNPNLKQYKSKDMTICRLQPSERLEGGGKEDSASLLYNRCSTTIDSTVPHFEDILPNVCHIAKQLDRLSLLKIPDSLLLSQPPQDIEKKTKFLMIPSAQFNVHPSRSTSSHSTRKREPKFVPYEPYKGCVKPILASRPEKLKRKNMLISEIESNYIKPQETVNRKGIVPEKFQVMVSDFEKERSMWEEKNATLQMQVEGLENKLKDFKKEQTLLQQQLSTQSQVNSELKKLLVASVGEDVQGRVQCLTEDKARMATMIRKYSEKVDRDFEEKEKMSIQCDVWRSKFLASSLLINELARWKGTLLQRFECARDSLKLLLQERDVCHHNLVNSYRHIHQVQEAFDPLHAEGVAVGLLDSCDLISLSIGNAAIAENVRDRLLGSLGRAVGSVDLKLPDESRTPGEKIAFQILEDDVDPGGILTTYHEIPSRAMLSQRFHPNTKYEHLTVNCCQKCSGEIAVV